MVAGRGVDHLQTGANQRTAAGGIRRVSGRHHIVMRHFQSNYIGKKKIAASHLVEIKQNDSHRESADFHYCPALAGTHSE